MKKVVYTFILLTLVVSGLVFANRASKNESAKKLASKPISDAESKNELQKWEATPEGIKFKNWETSPEGKKVLTDAAKINSQIKSSANMEATVTSLSLPAGSQLGFGIMININGADYILSFGLEKSNEFQQLHSLKINDKIIIKSQFLSYAPKYSYPIVRADYVEQNNKTIYKRATKQGGC